MARNLWPTGVARMTDVTDAIRKASLTRNSISCIHCNTLMNIEEPVVESPIISPNSTLVGGRTVKMNSTWKCPNCGHSEHKD